MTTFEQIDNALRAKGWRYDRGDEVFREGNRELGWEEVVGLVPSTSLDELASYQDGKSDDGAKLPGA
jgi:hypothetical protein